MQALLTVDQLAAHIHKSVASIRSDSTRNPNSLPPVCRLPGTKRLLWRIEDVERWIAQHVRCDIPDVNSHARQVAALDKPKRGRPTKAAQVAKQYRAQSSQDALATRIGN
jgi:hypothetical protein